MYEYIGVDGRFIPKNELSGKDSLRYCYNSQPEKIQKLLLPFPGDYAIQSNFHQRWKIFDHNRGSVTTVYGDTYGNDRVLQEIKASISASRFDMAPRVLDYSVQGKWIIEELIHGKELWPSTWSAARHYYTKHLNASIAAIIKGSPIFKVQALSYVLQKVESINEFFEGSSHLTPVASRVLQFVDDVSRMIKNHYPNETVLLVTTHGDFKFSHVIVARGEARVVDWETIGKRSALFDFLNPICPWLIHHEITETDAQDFPLIVDSFLQSIEGLPDDSFAADLKRTWDLHVEVFWIDRLARVLDVGHVSRGCVERSMARVVDSFERFTMMLKLVPEQQNRKYEKH